MLQYVASKALSPKNQCVLATLFNDPIVSRPFVLRISTFEMECSNILHVNRSHLGFQRSGLGSHQIR